MLYICCASCSSEKEAADKTVTGKTALTDKISLPKQWDPAQMRLERKQKREAEILQWMKDYEAKKQAFVDSNYILDQGKVSRVITPSINNLEEQSTFELMQKAYQATRGAIAIPQGTKVLAFKKHKEITVIFHKALPSGSRGSSDLAEVIFDAETLKIILVLGAP